MQLPPLPDSGFRPPSLGTEGKEETGSTKYDTPECRLTWAFCFHPLSKETSEGFHGLHRMDMTPQPCPVPAAQQPRGLCEPHGSSWHSEIGMVGDFTLRPGDLSPSSSSNQLLVTTLRFENNES